MKKTLLITLSGIIATFSLFVILSSQEIISDIGGGWYNNLSHKVGANANHNMGNAYLKGIGVEKDTAIAAQWFEKSAASGHAKSQTKLALIYSTQNSSQQQKAFKLLETAANQNYGKAQLHLGTFYIKGIGTTKNDSLGMSWLERAAEKGEPDAQYTIGEFYAQDPSCISCMRKAVAWLEKAAKDNHPMAQFMLGNICLSHRAFLDYEKAAYWLEKAEKKRVTKAITKLGNLYFYRAQNPEIVKSYKINVSVHYGINAANEKEQAEFTQKALEYYEQAIAYDDYEAINNLGYLYVEGLGVITNHKEAVRLFEKAAKHNYPAALYNLGVMHRATLNDSVKARMSFEYIRKAAKLGLPIAQYDLGVLYENGAGVSQNLAKASQWLDAYFNRRPSNEHGFKFTISPYETAPWNMLDADEFETIMDEIIELRKYSAQGSASHQCILGKQCLADRFLYASANSAFVWFQESARQGNKEAQYYLGRCYQRGIGVVKNRTLAKKWYTLSAKQGFSAAKEALKISR